MITVWQAVIAALVACAIVGYGAWGHGYRSAVRDLEKLGVMRSFDRVTDDDYVSDLPPIDWSSSRVCAAWDHLEKLGGRAQLRSRDGQ